MRFITEIESDLANFYKIAAERAKQTNLRELFYKSFKRNSGRRDALAKARRETITEMTLEPIVGLKLKEYALQIDRIVKDEKVDYLKRAITLEKIIYELYNKISAKVTYISADVSQILNRFSQESVDRKDALLKEYSRTS